MRADNIRNFRNAKGLSMEQVRELTGLSKSTISDSENPNGNPTEKTLEKLAEVYDVKVSDFYKENPELELNYLHSTNLSVTYFNGLMKWSEDKLLKKHETTTIRGHMSDLFLRYKQLLEQYVYAQRRWDREKESFSRFYKEKDEPLNDEEIKELYLKQELQKNIQDLINWINALPSWVAREESKYNKLLNETVSEENTHLLPNAANEIEGASDEDKAHDDALMDGENF